MAASSEAHGWVLEAVDRFEQPLTRYARRLLGDVDLAADAVQHAFVQLCGQSAATAAALAIDEACSVQAIACERLRDRLARDGQVLE
jgi:uncharacterized protein with beta-barrel porin domain